MGKQLNIYKGRLFKGQMEGGGKDMGRTSLGSRGAPVLCWSSRTGR